MTSKDKNPTVWSSSDGDMRKDPRYRKPRPVKSMPPQQQTAYLHRESKGRGGKTVSLVKNLILSDKDLKALAKQLKQACGTGGTIKHGVIEIQGEHREKIAQVLRKAGYKVKIAGG
jgi:translation initiation factor 1